MLTEMKKIYSDQADMIEGWKDKSKTELCNLYIQNENDEMLRNCYFSAIILNYWNKIYTLQANTYLTATLEDTYQWVVDGILYALEHRKWLDPNNKLYTDPDAPDKVINRRICFMKKPFLIISGDCQKTQNCHRVQLPDLFPRKREFGRDRRPLRNWNWFVPDVLYAKEVFPEYCRNRGCCWRGRRWLFGRLRSTSAVPVVAI